MNTIFVRLAIFATVANGHVEIERKTGSTRSSALGVVDPVRRCGGLATQIQLRISDCEGICQLVPGKIYNCENDFMPSKPRHLHIYIYVNFTGISHCLHILT